MHLLRHAGHHHFAADPSSQFRSIAAMANFAAMNPGTLSSSALAQLENASSGAPASMHSNDAERLESLRQGILHGFGGNSGAAQDGSVTSFRGPSGPSSTGSSESTTSTSAAAALGLLARGISRSAEGGSNTYSMDGNPNSNRQQEGKDMY